MTTFLKNSCIDISIPRKKYESFSFKIDFLLLLRQTFCSLGKIARKSKTADIRRQLCCQVSKNFEKIMFTAICLITKALPELRTVLFWSLMSGEKLDTLFPETFQQSASKVPTLKSHPTPYIWISLFARVAHYSLRIKRKS